MVMEQADNVIWLLIGLIVGQVVGYLLGHMRSKDAIKIAKMRMVADTGRDPLVVDLMEQMVEAPAPAEDRDTLNALNRKVKERFGDEFEVM